jgi:AcrR family transcriptional regulator
MPAAERRLAILAAARQEFAQHGFRGAATASIARAAGCSEAVLYRHFASKKVLLMAVLEEEVETRLAGGLGLMVPPSMQAGSVLPRLLEMRLADPETLTSVRLVLLALSMGHDPDVRPIMQRSFQRIREPIRAAIESGQRTGWVRDDLDPALVTWLWHGLFLVSVVRANIGRDEEARAEAAQAGRLLAALLAPSDEAREALA